MDIDRKRLLESARNAAEQSYSPYSRFRVGAALLCEDGTVIQGTNIENRSYGLTICAERNALGTAVSQGRRRFSALAVSCPDAESPVPPCGACRQSLSEFLPPDVPVFYEDGTGRHEACTMGDLLPRDSLHDLKDRTDPHGT